MFARRTLIMTVKRLGTVIIFLNIIQKSPATGNKIRVSCGATFRKSNSVKKLCKILESCEIKGDVAAKRVSLVWVNESELMTTKY